MKKNKCIKSTIIAAIIVFLWNFVSWMVFPWHGKVFDKFTDEAAVAQAIAENASESGVYILPNALSYDSSTPDDVLQNSMAIMQQGPTMFASVTLGGMQKSMAKPLIVSFIIQFIGAGIITWMLFKTKGLKYMQKVGFVTLFGLGVGILGILPGWNWWSLSLGYTLTLMADLIIGWFLAGLVMAKICKS